MDCLSSYLLVCKVTQTQQADGNTGRTSSGVIGQGTLCKLGHNGSNWGSVNPTQGAENALTLWEG